MAVTTLGFMIGSSRAFGYDSAVTVHYFVRVDSLAEVLTRQNNFNNHPLFSALSWALSRGFGSSEVAMRALPAVAAGCAVGVLGWAVARRADNWASATAMTLLATNPVFVSTSREVRGYSILVLVAVAGTFLVIEDRPGWLYAVALGIGIGTHLYALGVMTGHVGFLYSTNRVTQRWRTSLLGGLVMGSALYVGVLRTMVQAPRGREFRPYFPLNLTWELLGGATIAVLATGLLLGVGSWHRRSTVHAPVAAFAVAALLGPWLILRPLDLYPRFYVWVVPAVAIIAACAVHRHRRLALVAFLAGGVALWAQVPTWTADPLAAREAARAVASIEGDVCILGWSGEAVMAYIPGGVRLGPGEAVNGCAAAVVLLPDEHPELVAAARDQFGTETVLDGAVTPSLLFSHASGGR
ncbi:MAG: glycosyltransferase family 39 protein [Acidimicrobiia bacterium]|nr:glycosyltransferase family 39 protein [Acidimicrobiia bacterium]